MDVPPFVGDMPIHSRKLTWKPKKGPIKTTGLLKGGYMGFHVSLGECNLFPVPFIGQKPEKKGQTGSR